MKLLGGTSDCMKFNILRLGRFEAFSALGSNERKFEYIFGANSKSFYSQLTFTIVVSKPHKTFSILTKFKANLLSKYCCKKIVSFELELKKLFNKVTCNRQACIKNQSIYCPPKGWPSKVNLMLHDALISQTFQQCSSSCSESTRTHFHTCSTIASVCSAGVHGLTYITVSQ